MTREHVWGSWLKRYVRRDLNKHGFVYHEFDRAGVAPNVTYRIRAGDPLSSNARIVCVDCNTKWLSQIQENAKPHLIPLILGNKTLLGHAALERVATWAAMATMTGEYLTYDTRQIAISAVERTAFMTTGRPSEDWRIWIGFFEPNKLDERYIHTSLPIYDSKDISNVEHFDGAPQTNTQTTTFRIGKLFVHAMSSSDHPHLVRGWDWRTAPRARHLLVPIWPPTDWRQFVAWPVHGLLDADAHRFARTFFDGLNAVAAMFGA